MISLEYLSFFIFKLDFSFFVVRIKLKNTKALRNGIDSNSFIFGKENKF